MRRLTGFRFQIIIRISLILLLGFGAGYILMFTYFWLVSFWLILFMVIAIVQLIKYVENHKRKLSNFLIAIQQHDFSNSFTHAAYDSKDKTLNEAFQTITSSFQILRKEKESNYHFLQAVVEHTTVPTIGFIEESGKITLMNAAAKTLLGKEFLINIRQISSISLPLLSAIQDLHSGEKSLVKVTIGQSFYNLSVSAKELKFEDQRYKLVALQDIKSELEEKELEAWQKLIRVLTHEIKNSAIPISTLTEVIAQLLTDDHGQLKKLETLTLEDKEDLLIGLKTIEKRSKGLVKFINAYAELSKLPDPQLQKIAIKPIIENIVALYHSQLEKQGIQLNLQLQNMTLTADPELIEQVLINLLKNAIEALVDTKNPTIEIKASNNLVSICDNGPGIDPEITEQIFVPFFTTKINGSGIGLSISKQIMRAHKGDLKVETKANEGTCFYVYL